MTCDSPLILTIEGAIARLTLNRPDQLNSLDPALAEHFLAACQQLSREPQLRALILRANGRAFMAGGDLNQMHAAPQHIAEQLIAPMHQALQLLEQLDTPIIAAVQGAVAGAGISLMLAADLIIAADNSRFNSAYAQVAVSGDLGISWSLPRAIGLRAALDWMLRPRSLDAAEALHLGLINQVVAVDALEHCAEHLASQLAAGPTRAFGHIRRLLRQSSRHSLGEQLDAEAVAFADCVKGEDFVPAVSAFLGKRKPSYSGR